MKRTHLLCLLLIATMSVPLSSCKKSGDSNNPDSEEKEKKDPLEELKEIPGQVQGEIDLVLKPIKDAEKLIAEIESLPEKLKISLPELKAMLKAAFETDVSAGPDGVEASVNVDLSKLDITAEAREELKLLLALVQEIKAGLAATPENVATATTNLIGHATRATALGTAVATGLQARVAVTFNAEKKADLEQQIQDVQGIQTDIQSTVDDAKQTITNIPAEATAMGAKLLASFTGSIGGGGEGEGEGGE